MSLAEETARYMALGKQLYERYVEINEGVATYVTWGMSHLNDPGTAHECTHGLAPWEQLDEQDQVNWASIAAQMRTVVLTDEIEKEARSSCCYCEGEDADHIEALVAAFKLAGLDVIE